MHIDTHHSEDENPERPFLLSRNEDKNDASPDKEWFIKKTFENDPEKGIELLFKLYYRPLCSHAARYVYSKELAEDLVGEVFERFWRKQAYAHVSISFQAYLFTAVRYQAFQYLRTKFGKGKTVSLDNLHLESLSPSPQQLLQYDELYLEIEKAIRLLSPSVQRVFLMSRFEGKKNNAIAEELHISTKTVEAHITKVLKFLKKVLRQQLAVVILAPVFFFWNG